MISGRLEYEMDGRQLKRTNRVNRPRDLAIRETNDDQTESTRPRTMSGKINFNRRRIQLCWFVISGSALTELVFTVL